MPGEMAGQGIYVWFMQEITLFEWKSGLACEKSFKMCVNYVDLVDFWDLTQCRQVSFFSESFVVTLVTIMYLMLENATLSCPMKLSLHVQLVC